MTDSDDSSQDTPAEDTPSATDISPLEDFRFIHEQDDPIVITGLGCRLPGGNSSPSKLWDFLANNKSAQGPWPSNRLNINGFYHENRNRPGSLHAAGGYFLQEDINLFENDLFGINNLEATYMDPQQKKLLEVVYECLEDSGIPLEKISGSNVGCYVGNFLADHSIVQSRDPEYYHRYASTGMTPTILANRISHVFNLIGPSLVIDTACSSSIYALHLACQALSHGECDSAVVAAANLIQSPEYHIATDKSGVLSATSTCHSFDKSADGYGRADAVNAIYLKRLSAAVRDGDRIRAVVRGTAVNANGRTYGISLPKAETQAMVIRAAYAKAGLPMDETAYVECHGTGTAVGDPIEVRALSEAFDRTQKPSRPLYAGSVKSNLGHSEAASGLTSILKAVLAFDHGVIPATVGVQSLNPKIHCDNWNISIVTQNLQWPSEYAHQRISINSFGFGGANAHAILESPLSYLPQYASQALPSPIISEPSPQWRLLPFSANSVDSIATLVSQYADAVRDINVTEFLAAACHRRTLSHAHRGFIVGQEPSLQACLEELPRQIASKPSRPPPGIAFVFTGQGAQWPRMGKDLLDQYPTFKRTVSDLDAALQSLPDPPEWHLEDALLEAPEDSKVHHPIYSQSLCTAVQIGLVNVLNEWGIHPKGIIGHSSGEIAAAYAAGVLTARQAIAVAFYRGKGVSEANMDGAMLAVQLTVDGALREISQSGMEGKVVPACLNSPNSITLSGDRDGIEVIQKRLKAENKFARLLNTGGQAYHSPHMRCIGDKYIARLRSVLTDTRKPLEGIRFVSTCSNRLVDKPLGPEYWRDNAANPVLFSPGLRTLLDGHDYQLVEIGPHSALAMPIKQIVNRLTVQPTDFAYYSALVRGQNGSECLVKLAGSLFLAGHDIDFAAINDFDPQQSVQAVSKLPLYPWDYPEPVTNESRRSKEFRLRSHPRHDLLGSEEIGGSKRDRTWRNILNVKDIPWLKDHRLGQTVVFPAAGYCMMAIEAADQVQKPADKRITSFNLSGVKICNPLVLSTDPSDRGVEMFTLLRSSSHGWQFEISSVRSDGPTLHAEGLVEISYMKVAIAKIENPAAPGPIRRVSTEDYYRKLAEQGLTFGETFQSLSDIVTLPRTAHQLFSSGKTCITREQFGLFNGESAYRLHPVTLDAMLQSTIGATCQGNLQTLKAFVPTYLGSVQIIMQDEAVPHSSYTVMAMATMHEFCQLKVEANLLGSGDAVIARISDVRLTAFNGGQLEQTLRPRCPIQKITWKPDITLNSGVKLSKLDQSAQGVQNVLDLFCHKNPNLDFLEIRSEEHDSDSTDILDFLTHDSTLTPFHSYIKAQMTTTGQFLMSSPTGDRTISENPLEHSSFDFIVIPNSDDSVTFFSHLLLTGSRNPFYRNTFIAAVPSSAAWTLPQGLGYEVSSEHSYTSGRVIVVAPKRDMITSPECVSNVVLVESDFDATTGLNDRFAEALTFHGTSVQRLTLASFMDAPIPAKSVVVSLVELSRPVLKNADSAQLKAIQTMISRSTRLIWLTGGAVFEGQSPDFALVQGLARTVRLEQPDLELFTLDVSLSNLDVSTCADQIISIFNQDSSRFPIDYDFTTKDDVLLVSRLQADDARSSLWRQKEGIDEAMESLEDLTYERLTMTNPGRPDSLRFVQTVQSDSGIDAGFVEVCVQAAGLTPKNVATLQGKASSPDDRPLSQYTGIIRRLGSDCDDLKLGDQVVVLAPSEFRRYVQVPAANCHKLQASEQLRSMCSMPVPFVTALHALRDRIMLQAQDSILIHWDHDQSSGAAIQLAMALGATVHVVVEEETDKQSIIDAYGVPVSAVSVLVDPSLSKELQQSLPQRGFDALFAKRPEFVRKEVWAALDPFCRCAFTSSSKCGSSYFGPNIPSNATFTYVDLDQFLQSKSARHQQKLQQMFRDILGIYRAKNFSTPANGPVIDISDLTTCLSKSCKEEAAKPFVVSLENNKSRLPVSLSRYSVNLDADKTYLLIGCLGGLGRALSRWMLQRGAKNFLFMSRTGLDRTPAQKLAQELQLAGAHVDVVRGDVTAPKDVDRAVQTSKYPIGGVVQAAMGLNESVFSSMTSNAWHTGLDPKVLGSWNLHHSLQKSGADPNFFLLFSSLNGSVGAYTESNYCAANAFLDAFARFRRSQGLPCVALGLGAMSGIGYVADNPEIEAHFVRRGIRPLVESEFLQMIDTALSSTSGDQANVYDSLSASHMLTGLEPFDGQTLAQLKMEQKNPVENDPRALLWSKVYAVDKNSNEQSDEFATILKSISSAGGASTVKDNSKAMKVIMPWVKKGLSDLIVRPVDQIEDTKPLATYGIDSMLAAEYRSWFYRTFRIDVPLMDILSSSGTIKTLSNVVYGELDRHVKEMTSANRLNICI